MVTNMPTRLPNFSLKMPSGKSRLTFEQMADQPGLARSGGDARRPAAPAVRELSRSRAILSPLLWRSVGRFQQRVQGGSGCRYGATTYPHPFVSSRDRVASIGSVSRARIETSMPRRDPSIRALDTAFGLLDRYSRRTVEGGGVPSCTLNTPPRSPPARPGWSPCTSTACPRRSGASSRSPRRG